MREVDRGLVCVCVCDGGLLLLSLCLSQGQISIVSPMPYTGEHYPSPNTSCAGRELCATTLATVQPQWLMNNKIIIPIHAVIKWDWLYLPVCSHWAWSSIIIQSRGVRQCVYV